MRLAAALAGAWVGSAALAADYSFDLAEIEARPYAFDGFGEARAEHLRLREDAALLPLSFPQESPGDTLNRATAAFEAGGKFTHGIFTAYARASGSAATDEAQTASTGQWLEAGLRASPAPGLVFDLGKQVQRWGKGYAWNPVAFYERPKDPNDPALSREGFVMASADWVTSLPGTLAAVGFTPVLLPVDDDLNSDFGKHAHANPGAKLYLLLADTDIDLLWAAEGSRPQRFGFDFSRNLGTQLEVHGEWARSLDATRRVLGGDGTVTSEQRHLDSWLLGARYLTASEITVLAELYRNGAGYSQTQLARFYNLLDAAFAAGGGQNLQALARSLAQAGYGRANPGRDYAYLRISAKDPFDWLYVTPSLNSIVNLDDQSWQLTLELLYTGWQNVELRLRGILTQGDEATEFGEKPAAQRLELRLRWYF
ncbi:MAG: hypothetical protein U5L05_15995 [Rubrivivax sp.]|nr:hypothetical protein [Rubrivivax sp.]